ncbi:MAG: 50S ribosomal protein L11 methyltransferase [Fibrobacteria bacterium]
MQTHISIPSENLIAAYAPLSPISGLEGMVAHQAPDVFALWQAWENESGQKQDVPFWATVWPAARLLADFLGQNPGTVAGKRVLEFGCGCGIAGIAAAKAGAASVVANDIDPVALEFSLRNASANGIRLETDGGNLLARPPSPDWNVILVADFFYDRTISGIMIAWLEQARKNGSAVYIADGNRPFSPKTGIRVIAEKTFVTDAELEGTSERKVRLLEFLS